MNKNTSSHVVARGRAHSLGLSGLFLLALSAGLLNGCAFTGYPKSYQSQSDVLTADKDYLTADVRTKGDDPQDSVRGNLKRELRRRVAQGAQHLPHHALLQRAHSMKVTLLISLSVVIPRRALSTADSRRNVIPSSRANRLISDVGRRSRISSRIRSLKSSSS